MGTGAKDILRNAVCQNDLDGGGNRLVNFNTDNLVFGQFGVQLANRIYAGPSSGGAALPTFRIISASEVGAQPHDAGLDLLAGSAATNAGLGLLELPDPVVASYPFYNGAGGSPLIWGTLTPTQVRSNIQAQPVHANLTTLAGLTFTTTAFLTTTLPSVPKYTKLNANGTVSLLTAAEVATDIGAILAPFVDSTAIIKGSVTAGKLFRIEVDGWAGAVTRVMTPPDYDFTPASLGNISHPEDLIYKNVNGLTLAVGTAPDKDSSVTYTQTPAQPFTLSLVALASAAHLILRCNGPADLVVPDVAVPAETIAVVERTIPLSYLSTKTDLNDGGGASNTRVSSQLAVKTYVDAAVLTGGGSGGSGKSADAPANTNGSITLDPKRSFIQWGQTFLLAAGSAPYLYQIGIPRVNCAEGSIYRLRFEFEQSSNPTVSIYDAGSHGGIALQTIQGMADQTSIYVSEFWYDGVQWKHLNGNYVI